MNVNFPTQAAATNPPRQPTSASGTIEPSAIQNRPLSTRQAPLTPGEVSFDQTPAGHVLNAPAVSAIGPMRALTEAGEADARIGTAIKTYWPHLIATLDIATDTTPKTIGERWRGWVAATGHPLANTATQELISTGLDLETGGPVEPMHFCLDLVLAVHAPTPP